MKRVFVSLALLVALVALFGSHTANAVGHSPHRASLRPGRGNPAPTLAAVTFHVNSTADEPDALSDDNACLTAAGTCTLRAAIMQNNSSGGGNTIRVPEGKYILTRAEPFDDTALYGDLDVLAPVTIRGAGKRKTIIDAAKHDRVFDVFNRATLARVKIQNGATPENGGGILVRVDGHLILRKSIVSGNQALLDGSGIYGGADITVVDSSILNNLCAHQGSGIYLGYGGSISQTEIKGNCADQGGGIFAIDLTDTGLIWHMDASTVDNNKAHEGGGIFSYTGAHILNSTIAFNVANLGAAATVEGGGVYAANGGNFGDFYFYNTTIARNATGPAGKAGGIYALVGASPHLKNTILDRNQVGKTLDDCEGSFTLDFYNLIYAPTGCTLPVDASTQTGIHADLQGLANNGGPTPTMALDSGSEAIDAVPVKYCTDFSNNPLTTDQRGKLRPADGDGNGKARCDIGGYEVEP